MIFITGPLFSGKREVARELLHCEEEDFSRLAIWNVEDLAAGDENLDTLAGRLAEQYPVVIATEVGGGVVPIDPAQRRARERAGRLACLLAQRAERVVRVVCGIPTVLKRSL